MASSLAAAAAALHAYTDESRLLSLRLDGGEPTHHSLVVQALRGREALSECAGFELDCLVVDARIEAKALLGRRASVRLKAGMAAARWFNGVIMRVEPGEADGGRRRYRLSLRPALALKHPDFVAPLAHLLPLFVGAAGSGRP